MSRKRIRDTLWPEVLEVFFEIEKLDLSTLLRRLIEIVRSNQEAIEHFFDNIQQNKFYKFEENERTLFRFIVKVELEMYIIGTTGDDFKLIVKSYINQTPKSDIEVWRRVSNLITDIITFVSSTVCPHCQSDHLRILSDIDGINLYKSCETCSYTEATDKVTKSQEQLIPANVVMLKKAGYIS